jgi:hypothetical protein
MMLTGTAVYSALISEVSSNLCPFDWIFIFEKMKKAYGDRSDVLKDA